MADFLLLLAPIASGKTSAIIEMARTYQNGGIIYLSPLRSLANEFCRRCQRIFPASELIILAPTSVIEFSQLNLNLRSAPFLLIITYEIFSGLGMKKLLNRSDVIFILDEFHLVYYWGFSFRPKLVEVFFGLSASQGLIIGLTATMDQKLLNEWKETSLLAFERVQFLDYGNHQFHFPPKSIMIFPSIAPGKKILEAALLLKLIFKKGERCLIFCRYREEVFFRTELYKKMGFAALGMIGGQANDFQQALESSLNESSRGPQIIVATTALGHGVNLPSIQNIFITYAVEDYDLWFQMVGRGGRDGGDFRIYSVTPPYPMVKKSNIRDKLYRMMFTLISRVLIKWRMLSRWILNTCREKLKVWFFLRFHTRTDTSL